MSPAAFGLAFAAAVVHAVWNVALARTRDAEVGAALALALSVVIWAAPALVTWDVEWAALPYLAASGVLQIAYMALLVAAYRRADVSVVYPLARGSGPVVVLAISVAALGADLHPAEIAGVLVVALGVVLVRGRSGGVAPRHVLLALVVGSCIAGYTLVDKEGLHHASPLPYLWATLIVPAIGYLAVIGRLRGREALRAGLGWTTVGVAIGMFGAYLLVLAALRLAPAAPVAAIRETSVVLVAILAAAWLREPVGRLRLGGAALVAAGIALIAL